MHDHTLGCVQRNRMSVWHRMRNRDELNIERPYLYAIVVADFNELGLVGKSCLGNSVACETKSQRRAV